MISVYLMLCISSFSVTDLEAARILGIFPSSSVSHQAVFRTLTQELASRGHEMIVITSNPAFPKGKTPANLTEIDVSSFSTGTAKKQIVESATGNNNDIFKQIKLFIRFFSSIVEAQLNTTEVQALLADKNQKFDLLLIEACFKPALIYSHFYHAPVLLISSFGTMEQFIDWTGASLQPILYPTTIHQKLYNLTLLEKFKEIVKHYVFENLIQAQESEDDVMLQNKFGNNVPPLRELRKNVALIFIDVYRIWDNNRPVPPNVIYLGSLHMAKKQKTSLPKDLEEYMNNSENGVIYMSLGTNTRPSILPYNTIQAVLNVFSKVPYNVLLKWDKDELSGLPDNVKLFKWLPQSELLRHPKLKLFITQGGLQSSSEAIIAGVPMICMPMLGDQWYNAEQYLRHNIGLRLDIETLNEEKFMIAIQTVMNNDRAMTLGSRAAEYHFANARLANYHPQVGNMSPSTYRCVPAGVLESQCILGYACLPPSTTSSLTISYRSNVIKLRNQLHDQPETSLERAVWWTEYVIRHGGAKHLQASGAYVHWTEYYELQLIGVILTVLTLVLCVIGTMVYYLITLINRLLTKQTKIKHN